ncbi:unnamed protein product [Wickerhamomyces anomalus]
MSRVSTPGSRRTNAKSRRHSELVDSSTEINDNEEAHNESEESPDPKRRRSTRNSEINYSLTKRNARSNGKSHIKAENQPEEEIIVKKTKDATLIEDTKKLERHRSEESNLSQVDKLGKLAAKHSLLTQELFHLQQFTSLASWDPTAPPPKYYQDFVEENYNLWSDEGKKVPNGGDSNHRSSRRSRHSSRVNQEDSLKSRVDEAATTFAEEIFNPVKYYQDHFIIAKHNGVKSSMKRPMIIQPVSSSERSKVKEEEVQTPARPGRKPRVHNNTPQPKRAYRKKIKQEQEDDNDSEEVIDEDDLNNLSDSTDSEFDVGSPEPYITDGPIPKIKVKLSLPKATITNPDHIAKPAFESLEEYLNSYKSLDEDVTNQEYEEHIQDQQQLLSKIKKAVGNNVLKIDDDFSFSKVPPPFPFRNPLLNQHTHHDHLVAQAVHMSKLFENSRKARIQRARKVANMIEVHFKRAAGAADRARKEEERRIKTLARNAVQVVKKRWMLAERAYRILKNQEAEELRRIKGKEHLSQMLEHSTQLLEAQMTKQSDNEDNDSDDENKDIDMISSDGLNDGNLNGAANDEDDANLTVEELRAKYAHLQDLEIDEEEEEEGEQEEEEEQEGEQEEEEEEESPIEVPELTEKEKEAVKLANEDEDSLLDSDDSLESESPVKKRNQKMSQERKKTQNLVDWPRCLNESGLAEDDDEKKQVPISSPTPDAIENSEVDSTIQDDSKKSRSASHEPSDGVVDVPNPDLLLRGDLRTYQKQGLNWLASLYNNHTNGILADEMGLGKTIQTISLICYLAVNKGIWGPHLIIVPTSVILNWEMEFKRFAPGFKVMVYYGSPQQRKEKRKGWNKPDTFHVCITSYQLVCQDQQIFRRKRWRYMILDEAHNIKNFKSNRWNALLNFNTENRLLLTGTPLQNNIMELWSLLYFLMPSTKMNQAMPSGFANLDDFQQWFGKPVDKIIEGGDNSEVDEETRKTVHKLHQVLRPYLLRRLKADVEAQMPAKYEHVVYCRLSKRQYKLYHEYLARSDTKETLKNANYISIINALMQLRKVCNHPDLFEERPITTSFAVPVAIPTYYETTNQIVEKLFHANDHYEKVDLLRLEKTLVDQITTLEEALSASVDPNFSNIQNFYQYSKYHERLELLENLKQTLYLNNLRTDKIPEYGYNFIKMLNVFKPVELDFSPKEEFIKPLETRILSMKDDIDRFAFVTPAVVTMNMKHLTVTKELEQELTSNDCQIANPFHKLQTKLSIQFPDKSLLLYDCGKLQKLAKLLQQLKDGGHRALIFTQMTKVLDVLEQFLNIMGIRYMRLDGATKIEDRQILTERFNSDPRITVFILSTRSGGLGINLTGADTVIFYDSDWNPAMDKQCQDRCHQGEFTTDYFGKLSVKDLIGDEVGDSSILDTKPLFGDSTKIGNVLAQAEDDADAQAAKEAMKEVDLDNEDFNEDKSTQVNSTSATPGVNKAGVVDDDEFDDESFGHIDEYMIRFIANGHYYD